MPQDNHLIFRTRPTSEASLIAEHLQRLAKEFEGSLSLEICSDSESAKEMLSSGTSATLCQIYTTPERYLSFNIQQGGDLETALQEWMDDAQDTLMLHRKNRQRSLIFEAGHFCHHSEIGLARLGFSNGCSTSIPTLGDCSTPAPLPHLIAQAHLGSVSAAVALHEELDASAALLSNEPVMKQPPLTNAALKSYRAQTLQLADIKHERDTAQNSARTTLKSLHALREEGVVKDTKLHERETTLAGLETSIAKLQATLRKGTTALDASLQDVKRISQERDLGFRLRDDEIAVLSQELHKTQFRLQALEAEIERIMSSRSMRLTAPIRSLRSFLGKKP